MLTDSHAHLDMKNYQKDLPQVLDRAVAGGVGQIVTIGIDLSSSQNAVELAKKYDFVFATVGYHPHNAGGNAIKSIEKLDRLAREPEVVAWGEIGLDYFRKYAPLDDQLNIFHKQLEVANDINLPVIIHDREAHKDVFEAVQRMGKGDRKGVIHCFSGDYDLATAFIKLGYYISIPGTVTYNKAVQVKDVAAKIPLERLLVETDAPFLSPVPKRGNRNEPLFVTYTAKEIAKLRHIDFEEVAEKTTQNARDIFRLPPASNA